MDTEELEGVARDVLDRAGVSAPVDAFELAAGMDADVREYNGEPFVDLLRRVVYLPRRPMREARCFGHLLHELAHLALRDAGLNHQCEPSARYLAGALGVPRETLDRQLRDGWSIARLRTLHPNASNEMLVRRVTQLRPSVATVLDSGRVTVRVASPWLEPCRVARVRPFELDLAERALAEGEAEGDGPSVAARAGTARVVVVTRRWYPDASSPSGAA